MFYSKNKSFTLIELLVVIAVIGLFASVILVSMQGTREKTRVVKGLQFSQTVQHTLGIYATGWWSFDKGLGTIAFDVSGYGNNGTINGASYTSDTSHQVAGTGEEKYALSFNGSTDYVQMPHSSSMEPLSITIEFWVKLQDKGGRHCLVTKWLGYTTEVNADRTFKWGLNGLSSQYFGTKKITWDKWYHLVGTFDDTTKKQCIYINAKVSECQTVTGSINYNQQPLYLSGSWSRTKGLIDEVRIYESALSVTEIQKHYVKSLERHKNLAIE